MENNDSSRKSWLNAYNALMNLGSSPQEADQMLADARANGSCYTPGVDVQYFPEDDTFLLYTENL